ncbi:hypothetical protein AHiyo8_00170 [Arthrobacter sp. Hiyo8]|nr:hypothetical protein AHiyo8_00170 [Arthrobacter sp. Hiyo8]
MFDAPPAATVRDLYAVDEVSSPPFVKAWQSP